MDALELLYPDETTDLTEQELAPALAAEAENGWAIPPGSAAEEGTIAGSLWNVTAYLEGGPDAWSSEDAH